MIRGMSESGFVDVPGGRLYLEVEGDGPPLLLIPGGLGTLRMWDDQAAAFAEHYRVIRYDPRGFGATESEHVPFSNRADAAAVLAHVGAGSAHVVGQSRGGVIALDLTLERPKLVDSLVLVAAGVNGYEPELPEGVEPPPWDEMERLEEEGDWPRLAELETRVFVDGWGQPPSRVDPELRSRVHRDILDSYVNAREAGEPQPLQPAAVGRLDEVHVPTLVVVGTADEPGATASARFMAERIAGARLEELEGVAHMVHLEQPERFNRLVLDILAEVESARG
jgi:3-oxoadipate enol-lactonase